MAFYLHTAARPVTARKLSGHAEFMACPVAELVILAHVAIVAHFGYCLSVNFSTMGPTWLLTRVISLKGGG